MQDIQFLLQSDYELMRTIRVYTSNISSNTYLSFLYRVCPAFLVNSSIGPF